MLDLNVVYDLIKKRSGEDLARNVVRLALGGPYRLFLAAQAAIELRRTSTDPGTDSVLKFVADLPTLPKVPYDSLAPTIGRLTEILHPGVGFESLSSNDRSDITHLSESIHHKVRGFITSDKALLRASDVIRKQFRIEVISPLDLASDTESPTCLVASVEPHTLSTRPVVEPERSQIEAFLESAGVPASLSAEALQPMVGGTSRVRLVMSMEDSIIAYASWDSGPNPVRAAYFFADETFPLSSRVVDSMLGALASSLPVKRAVRIDLCVLSSQLTCQETAFAHGYRPKQSQEAPNVTKLSKVAYRGPVTKEDWPRFVDEVYRLTGLHLADQLPPFKEFANTGVMVRKDSGLPTPLRLFDFESLFAPIVAIPKGRSAIVVPIRYSYAEWLLGLTDGQPSLLPRPEAALMLERAYFRSSRHSSTISSGDIVLFYLSGHRHGGKEIVASARVTSSSLLTASEATIELSRQGVVSVPKLEAMADSRGRLHAFTFDSTTLFPHAVGLPTLRKRRIVTTQTFVCPFRLGPDAVLRLFRVAFEVI